MIFKEKLVQCSCVAILDIVINDYQMQYCCNLNRRCDEITTTKINYRVVVANLYLKS